MAEGQEAIKDSGHEHGFMWAEHLIPTAQVVALKRDIAKLYKRFKSSDTKPSSLRDAIAFMDQEKVDAQKSSRSLSSKPSKSSKPASSSSSSSSRAASSSSSSSSSARAARKS